MQMLRSVAQHPFEVGKSGPNLPELWVVDAMHVRGEASASVAQAIDPWIRASIFMMLLSIMVLPRFGLNLGEFSASVSMMAAYAALVVFALQDRLAWSPPMAILYAACMGVAAFSLLVNKSLATVDLSSPTSLLLLGVMYLPFVARLQPSAGEADLLDWTTRQFLNLAMLLAVAGIAQYYLQYVVHGQWLFDFTHKIPEVLRGPSGYNTVIEVESDHKSNGFFQREPSGFSFLMALALMLEWQRDRRVWRLGGYVMGLALSYSGTGLLALLIGVLFPLGPKTLMRLAAMSCVGLLAYLLLDDVLNLSFTLARVDEFGAERSSAYIRYIAPLKLVFEHLHDEAWGPWIGYGPGSIFRATATVPYEYHDPTWAKLAFEYGVLGFFGFVGLMASATLSSVQALRIRVVLLASWLLMGGHLLTADNVLTALLLCGLWTSHATNLKATSENST